jgi:hypothetical protein
MGTDAEGLVLIMAAGLSYSTSTHYNDVWQSADYGATWTLLTSSATNTVGA